MITMSSAGIFATILSILLILAAMGVVGRLALRAAGIFDRMGPGWAAGPIINGKNRSEATVLDNVCYFGDLHYFTRKATGPLKGKWTIEFEIKGEGFYPSERPDAIPYVSLHFQRKGDNWSDEPVYRAYRWYSATPRLCEPGRYIWTIDFEKELEWTPMMSGATSTFGEAKADPDRIGLVFGHSSGRGHGVQANASVEIIQEFFH